ncbi:MAG: class I SAM-dependent methyltransferase [Caldilineaceae bacterium]
MSSDRMSGEQMSQLGIFTDKAAVYHHRWDYAPAAIAAICAAMGGCRGKQIADLGAGNGMLGKHFLEQEAHLFAIDPDQAMLAEAQAELGHYATFRAICARAEATTLPPRSMDAVVVGRALHWFEPEPARQEVQRILKPNGLLAILRIQPADKAIREALASLRAAENGWNMRYGGRRPPLPPYARYFGHEAYQNLQFSQVIQQSWEQFWGELCSRSAAPNLNDPQIDHFRQAAAQLFARLSTGDLFTFEALTLVSLGQLDFS